MILLNQDTENIVIMTLSNDTDFTGLTYSLKITNEYNNYVIDDIILSDISDYTDRYNSFIISLTASIASQDKSSGIIYLKDNGFYSYEAYGSDVLFERGLVKVISDEEVISTISYTENDDDSFLSYEK